MPSTSDKIDRQRKRMAREAEVPVVEAKEIEVKMGSVNETVVSDVTTDPFLATADDIRKKSGLSPAMKRKGARMEKAHHGSNGAVSRKIEGKDVDGSGYALLNVVQPPYNLDYLAKLNEVSAPHYAAVKAKVANIVALGHDFVETNKTKRTLDAKDEAGKEKMRRKLSETKDKLMDWLESCNHDDDFAETLIKVWTDYETTGNGYIEIGFTTLGEVGYIGHIPATTMRIRKDRDGFVQMVADKVEFFRNFGHHDVPNPIDGQSDANEVIHLKKYSPTGNYYGIPDIVAARNAVAGNEFAAKFNLDYFENKAVPRYVIVIKGATLSNTAERNILEFFQTNLKGQNHRTLYVPLPADETDRKTEFKMEPVEAGTQDASFNNYKKGNLNEILMAHRVPISKVGMAEGVSLAVARDADKTFKEQVCRPEQRILERKLNKIIREKTDIFELKLNELTLTDEDTLSKMDERYLRWGVIVPNEVRARWGWTGLPNGNEGVGIMDQLKLQAEVKIEQQELAGEQAVEQLKAAPKPAGGVAAGAQAGQQKATQNASRTRAANRSSGASDSAGEARQPKGEGRATA